MTRLIAVAAIVVAVATAQQPPPAQPPATPPAPPQQQPPPADQQPTVTFKTGANVVRVDVTVVDRRGLPVTNLTPEDFELHEDGVPQAIQSFKLVEATGQPMDELSLPIRSPQHAAAEAARDETRVFLIFWDEYHIEQFVSAIRGREALGHFVLEAFGPTDLVAIMDPLLPVSALRFTRDRRALADQITKLQGRLGVFVPTRSAIEDAHLTRFRDLPRIRAEVTASALKAAAVHLGTIRQGRKSIIFVSQGLGALGRDAATQIDALVRTANEHNTAIYTMDPRGLTGRRPSDTLYQLADNTGAMAILQTNGLGGRLRQVVREASAFYLLGYASSRNPTDGKFHEIKVRVKPSGFEVRARRGYWAPSATAMAAGKAAAAAAVDPPAVTEAMASLAAAAARRIADIWIGCTRGRDGLTDVTITWAPREGADSNLGRAAVLSIATDGPDGPVQLKADGVSRRTTFAVRPGALKILTAVLDRNEEILERETHQVTVPEFDASRLALSAPMLLRAKTPLELRTIVADPAPAPFPGREFTRSDRVLVRFTVYGDGESQAAVSARLMTRRGVSLATLPVHRVEGGSGLYHLDLPLSSVARGEFLIKIEATRGDERVETLVPLRIVS